MELRIPLFHDLELKLCDCSGNGTRYPTSRLQKGFSLIYNDIDLVEEAVGFGVPILKRGLQTIFPGDIEFTYSKKENSWDVAAIYLLYLEEKIAKEDLTSVNNRALYALKNSLALLIRRFSILRGVLTTISNILRNLFHWRTTYEKSEFFTKVNVLYQIDTQVGKVYVQVDTSGLTDTKTTELIVMNEQGGNFFNQYQTNGKLLEQSEIDCWSEVKLEEGSFISSSHHIAFSVSQAPGAKLFRGRERVGTRLAWSGFGYSLSAIGKQFNYEIRINRIP
jgi:hypothetical protein